MKFNRILRIVLTVLAAAVTLAIAVSYQAVLERLGVPQAVADQVAPKSGRSPLVAFVASPLFLIVGFGIICVAVGAWLDTVFRAWDLRRAHHRWWEGLHTFSVKSFSCLVAGVPEADFEKSPRAKAVSAEILSYINSGHMPLALEMPREIDVSLRLQGRANVGPQYEPKNPGSDAVVFKRDLEPLAPSRGWKLPWPISPPDKPVKAPMIGAHLLDALQGKPDGERN